MPLPV